MYSYASDTHICIGSESMNYWRPIENKYPLGSYCTGLLQQKIADYYNYEKAIFVHHVSLSINHFTSICILFAMIWIFFVILDAQAQRHWLITNWYPFCPLPNRLQRWQFSNWARGPHWWMFASISPPFSDLQIETHAHKVNNGEKIEISTVFRERLNWNDCKQYRDRR